MLCKMKPNRVTFAETQWWRFFPLISAWIFTRDERHHRKNKRHVRDMSTGKIGKNKRWPVLEKISCLLLKKKRVLFSTTLPFSRHLVCYSSGLLDFSYSFHSPHLMSDLQKLKKVNVASNKDMVPYAWHIVLVGVCLAFLQRTPERICGLAQTDRIFWLCSSDNPPVWQTNHKVCLLNVCLVFSPIHYIYF